MQVSHRGTGTLNVTENSDGGYNTVSLETGDTEFLSYKEMVSMLGRPGTSAANGNLPTSFGSARIRDGRLHFEGQLSPQFRQQMRFQGALMRAIQFVEKQGFRIYATGLNDPELRNSIRDIARQEYRDHPISAVMRGGSISLVAVIPRGRTLMDKYEMWVASGFDDMVLPDQAHLRGNRTNHGVDQRVYELISEAIEKIALDSRKPTPAAVLRKHKDLVVKENEIRRLNGLKDLRAVAHKTISTHIKNINKTARDIARNGERWAANNRSSGSTDYQALMIGELVEIDECKLSLIVVAKRKGLWKRLSMEHQEALEEIDEIIKRRIWLVLMIDVATRMPLGWALTDTPSHEVTLDVMRMATRDKTREARRYGCEREPMPATGLGSMKGDNGTGLRNSEVKSSALGIKTQTVDARAYHGVDKPYIERMFGTIESVLLNLLHGYTGRRAGQLPGYDPIKCGVLDVEELYGIITRYLVDEYPDERHYGVTMTTARPAHMAEAVNDEYGMILPPPDHDRRIQLGWASEAKITDEGVKVFNLPYNSSALQELRDEVRGKVTVYVDPDNIADATVLIVGHPDPILVELMWTAMRDLTLPEFLEVALQARKETPEETRLIESQLARIRGEREDHMTNLALEHKLPRSFMTLAEANAKAHVVRTGLHESRPENPMARTTPAGGIMDAARDELPDHNTRIQPHATDRQDLPQPTRFAPPKDTGKLS
jgi:putative transposase